MPPLTFAGGRRHPPPRRQPHDRRGGAAANTSASAVAVSQPSSSPIAMTVPPMPVKTATPIVSISCSAAETLPSSPPGASESTIAPIEG